MTRPRLIGHGALCGKYEVAAYDSIPGSTCLGTSISDRYFDMSLISYLVQSSRQDGAEYSMITTITFNGSDL